jgi:hypothetical protein
VELERIHGESNLRTFADGFRVLRTIGAEFRRARAARRRPALTRLDDVRNFLHPRTDLIELPEASAAVQGRTA